MPHTGNFTTHIPGPYPPAHMGGEDIAFAAGDTFRGAGTSGQLENRSLAGEYKQNIVTRYAIDSDGTPREIEITDCCLDKQGNLYVPLSGLSITDPIQWGGPQIQKFDNRGNDLGRWDQNVFFATPGGVTGSLLPVGICCLKDNTIAVLAARSLTPGDSETAEIWHLDRNGSEITHWAAAYTRSGGVSTDVPLELASDGQTVYYTNNSALLRVIHRFDVLNGVQLTPISGVDFDMETLIVLPDNGVILSMAFSGSDDFLRRYDVNGSLVWQRTYTGAGEPGGIDDDGGGEQGITPDGRHFYFSFFSNTSQADPITTAQTPRRTARLSVEDGSIVDYYIPAAIIDNGEAFCFVSWNNKAAPAGGFATVIGAT